MTIIRHVDFTCSNCGTINNILTEDSITTWLYDDLVMKVYKDEFFFDCENCGRRNRINKHILVNTRKGMFILDTSISKQAKRELLVKYGVVDEKGTVLKQKRLPANEVKNDPVIDPIVRNVQRKVEQFRDELLDEEEK